MSNARQISLNAIRLEKFAVRKLFHLAERAREDDETSIPDILNARQDLKLLRAMIKIAEGKLDIALREINKEAYQSGREIGKHQRRYVNAGLPMK